MAGGKGGARGGGGGTPPLSNTFNNAARGTPPPPSKPVPTVKTNTDMKYMPRNVPTPGVAPRGMVGTQKTAAPQSNAKPGKAAPTARDAATRARNNAEIKGKFDGKVQGPTVLKRDFDKSR